MSARLHQPKAAPAPAQVAAGARSEALHGCERPERGPRLRRVPTASWRSADDEPAAPPIVYDALRASPGRPLDPVTRAFMEPRFGHDFSRVRVHTDAKAAESARTVNAAAYTVGSDVVFGAGQYAPNSATGGRLLAHELAHVAQEGDGDAAPSRDIRIGASDDRAERQADAWAETVDRGGSLDARGAAAKSNAGGRARRKLLRRQTLLERIERMFDPRTRQFISDLIASVRESPQHVVEFITGDLWDTIREHWPSILAVTLGLLAIEGVIAALGAAPTGVTQVIAAILEVIVLAVLAAFAAVEIGGVIDEGVRWWTTAREANGDPRRISEASRAFVRMVWHILMAVLAVAGVRARIRGGAIGRVTAPLREPPPPTAPPPLRVIQGGDPRPVRMEGGRVVSQPRTGTSRGAPLRGPRGSALPAEAPRPMPEPEPAVRPVPDPAPVQPEPAAAAGPRAATGPRPRVQPLPAAGAGLATGEVLRQREHRDAYPILWPLVFGPPALFGAPITVFFKTASQERDESYALEVRRELWARHRGGDPDLMPSDYHAHHIVPLFLGGLEGAKGNIMFLPGRVHLRGHGQLASQPQMAAPPPPLAPLPANILVHPTGTKYELVGFK